MPRPVAGRELKGETGHIPDLIAMRIYDAPACPVRLTCNVERGVAT